MSESSNQPWSNGPNAPQIPYTLYIWEKRVFAGYLIGTVLYGILVALFFQCMSALLLPARPTTKGIRWGLVAHTIAVFSFSTIGIAIDRDVLSDSYINGREFAGAIPGPVGFLHSPHILRKTSVYVVFLMLPFNQWLSDGLLLYRCFVIYSMSYWAIVIPSLTYLASIVTSVFWFYFWVKASSIASVYDRTYMAICVSLNVLLSLMIIVRLALHSRNIRNAIGASSGAGGLYTALITMLVESSALNAVGYLLFIISGTVNGSVSNIFAPAVGEIQAISVFLITLRVTNRTALTGDAVTSGKVDSIHFRSEPGGSIEETFGRFGVEVETQSQET